MARAKPRVVVKCNKYTKEYEVWIVNGVQSFQLRYTGTKAECSWFKRMMQKAGVG